MKNKFLRSFNFDNWEKTAAVVDFREVQEMYIKKYFFGLRSKMTIRFKGNGCFYAWGFTKEIKRVYEELVGFWADLTSPESGV